MRTAYINPLDLTIVSIDYDMPSPIGPGPSFTPPPDTIAVPIPDTLRNPSFIECYRTENNTLALRYNTDQLHAYAEQKRIELRERRNELLKECDWVALIDNPMSDETKAAWAAYRQGLRDMPQNLQDTDLDRDISELPWPLKP